MDVSKLASNIRISITYVPKLIYPDKTFGLNRSAFSNCDPAMVAEWPYKNLTFAQKSEIITLLENNFNHAKDVISIVNYAYTLGLNQTKVFLLVNYNIMVVKFLKVKELNSYSIFVLIGFTNKIQS